MLVIPAVFPHVAERRYLQADRSSNTQPIILQCICVRRAGIGFVCSPYRRIGVDRIRWLGRLPSLQSPGQRSPGSNASRVVSACCRHTPQV